MSVFYFYLEKNMEPVKHCVQCNSEFYGPEHVNLCWPCEVKRKQDEVMKNSFSEIDALRAELELSKARAARLYQALNQANSTLEYLSGYSNQGSALTMVYSAIENAQAAMKGE